jgi:uncharacterized membrane protein
VKRVAQRFAERVALVLLFAACGKDASNGQGIGEDTADRAAACQTDTGGGYPTWAGFGEGFFAGRCASCHAASAPERFGAPDTVTFDSEDDVLRQIDAVQRVILDDASMPPGGGLHADELERLAVYLDCLRAG